MSEENKIEIKTEMSRLEEKGEVLEGATKKDLQESKVAPSAIKTTKTALVPLTAEQIQTLDYTDFSTPARMLELGKVLVQSKLVIGKTPEDVVVSLMAGRELGLPFVVSLSQIYPINGKPSLGVHLIKGLILKHKIIFYKIEDFAPMFAFYEKTKDGSIKKDGEKPVLVAVDTLDKQPPDTLKRKTIVGYRTTYEFIREVRMPSGKYREQKGIGSFSTIEAQEADLMDKENWKKYVRRMLDARAFANGAREVADDIINGMMTPDELGANSFIDERGQETVDISYTEG